MDTLFATTKPHYINVKKVDVTEISHNPLDMVAGAGFEPTTFGL